MPSTTGCRLTLKFNFAQQIRMCGWSESYDLGYASLAVAIASSNAIAAFITDRINCLGIGPILVEAVLGGYTPPANPGDRPVRRATLSFPVPPAPPPGEAYNKALSHDASYDADYGTTVLLLRAQTSLSGVPVYSRSIWLAGLPDAADLTSNMRLTDPATNQAVQKFQGDLQNTNATLGGQNSVSIRSIDRAGTNAIKRCAQWVAGPPISFNVPAHGFAVGQPVQAEGCTAQPGGNAPRGRYLVSVRIDADNIQLAGVTSIGTPINTGGFRASVVAFNPISVIQIEGMTKRNKGRPFGLSVGRRPKLRTKRA